MSDTTAAEQIWVWLHATAGGRALEIFAPYVAQLIAFVIVATPFSLLDLFGCPKNLLKFKVYPEHETTRADIKKCLPLVLFNLLIVRLLLETCVAYPILKWRGNSGEMPVPCVVEFLVHFVTCILIEDFLFYMAHRLMHTKTLYPYHNINHSVTFQFSLTSFYMHPVEQLKDFIPMLAGPFLLGSHTSVRCIWCMFVMAYTIFYHSGYMLPLLPSSEFHSLHYQNPKGNFSVMGITDVIFDTDLDIVRRTDRSD